MILVTNIQWDTNEEKVELPTSIAIYDSEELETSIAEGNEVETYYEDEVKGE